MSSSSGAGAAEVTCYPKSLRWPIIVISLLSVHLLLMLLVAAIATRDRSFAVIPDYYRNAIEWDQRQAQRRASEALGWKLTIEPSEQIDPLGRRAIRFTLTDAQGRRVEAAFLDVSCFHHAHARDVVRVTLSATEPGRFAATLPMRYPGFWQFDIKATARDQMFTTSITHYVNTQTIAKR
jgi:nitrogen fixation protein FixH